MVTSARRLSRTAQAGWIDFMLIPNLSSFCPGFSFLQESREKVEVIDLLTSDKLPAKSARFCKESGHNFLSWNLRHFES